MTSSEDLLQSLQATAAVTRTVGQQAAATTLGAYSNSEGRAASGAQYQQLGDASVPQGTSLAANYDPVSGEVVWVETYQAGESGTQLAPPSGCAGGTDCLDGNFCYGWYECDPCEWCESNQCQQRDENRPCAASWECPCAPADDQHYDCVSTECKLTCQENSDCPEGKVCGLVTGYCEPACKDDGMCDPLNASPAGDAQVNTFCVKGGGEFGECQYACDPVRFCKADGDCKTDEYCGDREYRVASDPIDGLQMCLSGCRDNSSCEAGETCDQENRSCYSGCISDADCADGEGCNDDGRCSKEGMLCCSDSDCNARDYCSDDGRCSGGCRDNAGCAEECEPDQACRDACPADPTCTCEGDGCYNENWRELCPPDPGCLEACPDDPECVRRQGSVCIENNCERPCSDTSNCLGGEVCNKGLCMVTATTPTSTADARLGCEDGDECNQYGTCEPIVCRSDDQCPSGAVCVNGVCVEGCSTDNPCPGPGGDCCNSDGTCGKSCRVDLDCASEPGNSLCLEGGCCGLICEPLVACVSFSDCQAGEFCGEEGYCMEGCSQDSDCADLEGRHRCSKTFVKAKNGALAPCEFYPNEECFSEIGKCEAYCIDRSDCGEEEICVDGDCQSNTGPEPGKACGNDNQCYSDQTCAEGCTTGVTCEEAVYNGEICKAGICESGCRYDSQCPTGEICRANACEVFCTNSAMCAAVQGDGSSCIDGICTVINEGEPGEGGRKGCECHEFCDEEGYCKPFVCNSDLECEEEACGSCLAGNVCGPCFSDSDCPGKKICDIAEGSGGDEVNSESGPVGGTCAYACTPGGPTTCKGSRDCPAGFYCEQGQCQRGCEENEDCQPGSVCRGEACVRECVEDAQCGFEERCIAGGCRYVGEPCLAENAATARTEAQIDNVSAEIEAKKREIELIKAPTLSAIDRLNLEEQSKTLKANLLPIRENQKNLELQYAETNRQVEALKAKTELSNGEQESLTSKTQEKNRVLANLERIRTETEAIGTQVMHVDNQLSTAEGDLSPAQEAEIEGKEAEVEQLEGQANTYRVQLEVDRNRDCSSNKVCNGDQCEYPEPECLADFECEYPARCVDKVCRYPAGSESYSSFEPEVIGCESCADTCDNGICRPQPCVRNDECGCGICSPQGVCLEECLTDLDCGTYGVCEAGECMQCRTNGDCAADFGIGAICDGGECKTPCGVAYSTGSCLEGLSYGDTCEACPKQCPGDAPCLPTNEVCSTKEIYDPITKKTRVNITNCRQCSKICINSTDCEDGYTCGGFGICTPDDGRCTFDSDCIDIEMSEGEIEMICRNNTCIEKGEMCFTNGDCDGGELCDGNNCITGECTDENNPCQAGKTCVDNTCVWECGSDAQVFLCGNNSPSCPPGFRCHQDSAYGGYCLRVGMRFSEVQSPGCPVGTICCGGGCVATLQDGKECCDDSHCGNMKCCDGMCKGECEQTTAVGATTPGGSGPESAGTQDPCQSQGKCCGEDGFCEPCGCDEKNPCPGGQCCDRDSGECAAISAHPDTKYGAPYECRLNRVFCELEGPEDENETRSAIDIAGLAGPDYRGCEVIDPVKEIVKCWEGGELNDSQVRKLVEEACWRPKKKECRCDDIPSEDECVTDKDCICGSCKRRQYRSDACCGVYGEGEYETTLGFEVVGTDYISRNICVGDDEEEEDKDCGCRSNEDCTACEVCEGGGVNALGRCVADCDNRCPCGGELSRGQKCKTCEEKWGLCAVGETYVIKPKSYDRETGEEISEESACACVLDRSKECCLGHNSFDDLQSYKYSCLEKKQTYGDGTVRYIQTKKCIDPENDVCAECEVDAHCAGPLSRCKKNVCVTQCGLENSNPGQTGTADKQGQGDIGGNIYECWCCSEEGECKAKRETWLESKARMLGPWTLSYKLDDNVEREWRSEQEQYASAEAEIRNSFPGRQLTITNADGENSDGDCRPCMCGETGIECAAWKKCEGCYKWQAKDDIDNAAKYQAEIFSLEVKLGEVEESISAQDDYLIDLREKLQIAEGQYFAAIQYFSQFDETIGDQLELKAEEEAALTIQVNRSSWEVDARRAEVDRLQHELSLAIENEEVDAAQLIAVDLDTAEAEFETSYGNYSNHWDARDIIRFEIQELEQQLAEFGPSTALELYAERKSAYSQAASNLRAAQDFYQGLLSEQAKIAFDLQMTYNPQGTVWEQVRTADCCVEGQSRDDNECTYGTCFICVDEYEGEYRAALYGKVLSQLISYDTEMPESDPRKPIINGPTIYKYVNPEDQCVKVACADGWYYEERMGQLRNTRYYEYCTGSVLGCVLSYKDKRASKKVTYLQGWKYEAKLDQAGIYYTSDWVNWVKMGYYEGGPDEKRLSECLYENQIGFLGGSDLGVFYELVATHPICNYAEMWHECPPEHPRCQSRMSTYYQPGNKDNAIKKLEQEIRQLTAYQAILSDVLRQLGDLDVVKRQEKNHLIALEEEVWSQLTAAQVELFFVKENITILEGRIPLIETERDAQTEEIEERRSALEDVLAIIAEKYEIRIAAEEELYAVEFELSIAKDNRDSARSTANTRFIEIGDNQAHIAKLQNYITFLIPESTEYVQAQVDLVNAESNLEQQQSEYDENISAALGFGADYEDFYRIVNTNSCSKDSPEGQVTFISPGGECASLKQKLSEAQEIENYNRNFYPVAVGALARAKDLLPPIAARLNSTNDEIAAKKLQVDQIEENIEYLIEQGGEIKCDNKGCKRSCAEICDRIKKIQEILTNIVASRAQVNAQDQETLRTLVEKRAEVAALNAQQGPPAYLTGPERRPSGAISREELIQRLKDNQEVTKYLDDQEDWVAKGTAKV